MKIFIISFFLFLSFTGVSQPKATSDLHIGIERPRLIVGIVVDQMRWDYLYRYYDMYGTGGFKRILKGGYSFENTFIPYAPSVTGAGHATIYTGAVPAVHGIVGNNWVERNTGNEQYCTTDKSVQGVGATGYAAEMSPLNLFSTTIGDELRLSTNFRSRVFGIALKDRGSILPAGRSGNAAYWFEDATGNWITSTWYMPALPLWVDQFNKKRMVDSLMSADWNLLYNSSKYVQSAQDKNEYEKTLRGRDTFPYSYKSMTGKNYYDLRVSPGGNTLTLAFAKEMIRKENLGKQFTDMLCISLSSTDYVGHYFGVSSMEVQDTYLRLDKELADFLNYLDNSVGKGQYLLFLSADHAAPYSPSFMNEHKLSAGFMNGYNVLRDSLNAIGMRKFGVNNLVNKTLEYQVYLNHTAVEASGTDPRVIKKAFTDYLNERPEVAIAFDYADFSSVILPEHLRKMLTNGYYYKRSSDIQFILKPAYNDIGMKGADHGTMYNDDIHIPLLWYGWNIKPGRTNRETYMTDIAPTIAALLRIQMPNGTSGKVLTEITNAVK